MKIKTLNQISVARRIILGSLIVYILVFFALNASKISADNIMRFFYDFECVLKDKPVADTVFFEESDSNLFTSFKNGLVSLTNRGVSVYNEKNILISEFPANYTKFDIDICGDNIVFFEREGTKIYRANSFEIESSAVIDENISNLSVDERGYCAVITDSYGYRGRVTVYNKYFESLYYWSSSSLYPIYAEFVNGDTIAVISVSPDKESCNTVFTAINFTTGEELASFTEYGVFPIDIHRNNDGSLDVLTVKGLYKFTVDGAEEKIGSIGRDTTCYDLGENAFVFAEYSDKTKNISEITVYNKYGEELFSKEVENLKYTACGSEYIYISAGKIIYVVDMDGNTVYEQQTDFNIQKIIPVENGAYLISSDRALKINLR